VIDVTFTSGNALPFVVTQIGDYYSIRLNAIHIGPSRLSITADKADHAQKEVEFLLTVVEIDTAVNTISLVDALYYGRAYTFNFHYTISGNGTGVGGAMLNVTGIDSEWIGYRELGTGEYEVNITPGNIGEFIAAIRFSRNGFREQTTNLVFEVDSIRINVDILSQSNWVWNTPLVFSLSVTESDTGDPISNAVVTYVLLRFDGVVDDGQLNETSLGSGVYTGTASTDWDERGGLKVRFSISKAFFEWDSYLELEIVEILPPDQVNLRFLYVWGPRIGLVVGAVVSLGIGQRAYSKRRREYIARALEVKRRFDDANNLIGIVILHKTSGLPVYSNILKGGFEEGMISAFITAITHFRSEFDRDDYDHAFEILPISDIIRAVPTRNLVCAFITVSSASMQQEARMIEFAKGVSRLMDDDSAVRPTEVNNIVIADVLEKFFDEVMEGFLLRYYKRGRAGSFPKRYRCLEEALNFTEAADCSRPTYLATVMTDHCKITEAEASLLVLESIEAELIVPCSKHEVISFTPAISDDGKDLPDGPVRM
jgi:hypothetical protein